MEELDLTKIKHDKWSELGLENLGGIEGMNVAFMRLGTNKLQVFQGPFNLLKCILNDYWADIPDNENLEWNHDKINMVMSKLYFCWVAMIQAEVNDDDDQRIDDHESDE